VRLRRDAFGADLDDDALLWSEAGGFLLEVAPGDVSALAALARKWDVEALTVGAVTGDGRLVLEGFASAAGAARAPASSLDIASIRTAWENGLGAVFGTFRDPEAPR